MAEYKLSFDKLLLGDPGRSKSTGHIFVSHQPPAEEKHWGKLFMLAEIHSNDSDNPEIIKTIQEELVHRYYQSDDLNIETAFERALEATNQRIADMVGDFESNWLDRFSTVVIIIKEDTLVVSSIGTMHAFLVRGNKITDVLQTVSHDEPAARAINPLKAFSSVISGQLEAGDALLICTPTLLDYFSLEKLKRMIQERETDQAIMTIEHLLTESTGLAAFYLLVIKVALEQMKTIVTHAPAAPQPSQLVSPIAPQSSMDNLLQKQADTSKILSPSISRYIAGLLRHQLEQISSFFRLKVLRQSPRRIQFNQTTRVYQPPNRELVRQPSTAKKTIASISHTVAKLPTWVITSLHSLLNRRASINRNLSEAPQTINRQTNSLIVRFKSLSRISKIVFIAIVVVLFVLAQSLYSAARSRHAVQTNTAYQTTVSKISDDITKAEAALSYNNESNANELLKEAADLINGLPNKTNEQKAEQQSLRDALNVQLEKTKHIIALEVKTLATISAAEAVASVKDLIEVGSTLYTIDPTNKKLYAINTTEGSVKPYSLSVTGTFQYSAPLTTKSLVLFTTTNAIQEYNTQTNTGANLTFELGLTDANIIGIATYESRLYLLDIKNNQIFRSIKTGNGFSKPASWIKDSTDVRTAQSMAVDGSIFVLKKSGDVVKLTQGIKQSWSLANVEPALTKADKIWTSVDSKNIYILDAAGKRILEFSKDGSFLNQYTSTAFTDLHDLTVDPAHKMLYVLNGTAILSASFQ